MTRPSRNLLLPSGDKTVDFWRKNGRPERTVARGTITFRRLDKLHVAAEILYFQVILVVLGDPVRRQAARAMYLSYCPIEMYVKGALGGAKMYSGCNARAYFSL